MLRIVFFSIWLLAMGLPAQAQDISETHLNAAYRAISALGATDRFDAILPTVAERIKAQLIANNPDVEAEILTTVEDVALSMVARRGDLERESALAYANAFAEADLVAIADFYESEAGMALLENGRIVTRELAQLSTIWSRGIQRDLLRAVSDQLNAQGLREGGLDVTGAAESAAEGSEDVTATE
ncbi:MAG: DUF2059 domain-containing protein [Pseudomonadota bacterium]